MKLTDLVFSSKADAWINGFLWGLSASAVFIIILAALGAS